MWIYLIYTTYKMEVLNKIMKQANKQIISISFNKGLSIFHLCFLQRMQLKTPKFIFILY